MFASAFAVWLRRTSSASASWLRRGSPPLSALERCGYGSVSNPSA